MHMPLALNFPYTCAPYTQLSLRMCSFISVLLYVREKHETVFTALMLRIPTLHGLMLAVSNFKTNTISNSIKFDTVSGVVHCIYSGVTGYYFQNILYCFL